MALANQSVRTILMKAIRSHLGSSIRVAKGYTFDIMEDAIFLGQSYVPTNTPLPCIVIFEHMSAPGEDKVHAEQAGGSDDPALAYWVPLDISGWAKVSSPTFPAEATYELMADVKKAMGLLEGYIQTGEPFYGIRLADEIHDPGVMLPATSLDQKTINAQFLVEVALKITESIADPYRLDD